MIQLVNYWPDVELDEYIKRVLTTMVYAIRDAWPICGDKHLKVEENSIDAVRYVMLDDVLRG